ncbi:MAG: ribulose-phosphate 3-epimerase, partial [Clostridiales Family XIII bacterium]|nr:ribulose-phosphate 3-epimerase [Clostridiales Family XIII bacterium]
MILLSPSILAADMYKLAEQIKAVEDAGAHLLHLDVMDGRFVPNISYGPAILECLKGRTRLPFDVHLMIEDADKFIPAFVKGGAEYITVHQEACVHLHRTLATIRSHGLKAGVALNPATSLSTLDYVLDDVDLVLLMSVEPGFGGQKFIPKTLDKARALSETRRARGLDFKIQVDGGVNMENAKALAQAG